MPEYVYTARTEAGDLRKDRMVISDERALAQYLRGQGLLLTSAHVESEAKKKGLAFLNIFRRIPIVERVFFTQNLEIMIRTGFSLALALKTLSLQTEHKRFREIIQNLGREVESGASLSNALKKYPDAFSEMFVNMVAAGEVSGKLDEVLRQLTIQMKKEHALISKVRAALTYPAIVVVAMIAISILMMTFVFPKMISVYEESAVELPLPTKILIAMSNFLVHNGLLSAAAAVVLTIIIVRLLKTERGKRLFHRLLIKMPIFGAIVRKVNLARFTRSLSSLLKTDIPIVQTFQIIAKQLRNVHYRTAMLTAAEQVKQGVAIRKTLESDRVLFPPIVTQMIAVGEESGTLDTISEEVANFYEADVDQTMATLSTIIEPVLMLVLGVGVAGLAIAVLLPMYNLVNAIS